MGRSKQAAERVTAIKYFIRNDQEDICNKSIRVFNVKMGSSKVIDAYSVFIGGKGVASNKANQTAQSGVGTCGAIMDCSPPKQRRYRQRGETAKQANAELASWRSLVVNDGHLWMPPQRLYTSPMTPIRLGRRTNVTCSCPRHHCSAGQGPDAVAFATGGSPCPTRCTVYRRVLAFRRCSLSRTSKQRWATTTSI